MSNEEKMNGIWKMLNKHDIFTENDLRRAIKN